ncbi:hypothetical protein OH77DRAFT_1411325, partial [Trametes cingulata]
ALLAYEYLITLDREVALFWKRKTTGATVLFLGTRYLALLSITVLTTATYARVSDSVITRHAEHASCAAFSALRTLALSSMNRLLASVVFVLACAPSAVNIWSIAGAGISGSTLPVVGCEGGANQTPHQASPGCSAVAVSRSCAVAADIIVVVLTWRYTLRGGGIRGATRVAAPSLARVLFLDGTIYFLLIGTMNLLQLILTLVSVSSQLESRLTATSLLSLAAILICRFLLSLQSANLQALDVRAGDGTTPEANEEFTAGGSLHFASRVVGSMAGSLAVGRETSLFDDDIDENGTETF